MDFKARTIFDTVEYGIILKRIGGLLVWQYHNDGTINDELPLIPFEELTQPTDEATIEVYFKYVQNTSAG